MSTQFCAPGARSESHRPTASTPAASNYEIDLTRESILSRSAVGALLAKWQTRRKALHENHVTRLMRTGVRGIVLPSLLVGNRRISSVEACRWWIAAVTAADANHRGVGSGCVAPLTPAQREILRSGLGLGGDA